MGNVNAAAFFEKLEASETYQIESAKIDFALELKRLMDQKGLNNAKLASLLGVSRPRISKLLRGDSNVTIESMAQAAYKLDSRIFIKMVRKDAVARLFEVARCSEQARTAEIAHGAKVRDVQRAAAAQPWYYPANDIDAHETQPLAA